jgi:hypothetical protein
MRIAISEIPEEQTSSYVWDGHIWLITPLKRVDLLCDENDRRKILCSKDVLPRVQDNGMHVHCLVTPRKRWQCRLVTMASFALLVIMFASDVNVEDLTLFVLATASGKVSNLF